MLTKKKRERESFQSLNIDSYFYFQPAISREEILDVIRESAASLVFFIGPPWDTLYIMESRYRRLFFWCYLSADLLFMYERARTPHNHPREQRNGPPSSTGDSSCPRE